MLFEEFGKLFGHRPAEFLGVHNGDRTPIVSRHVVPDTDRNQLYRRSGLDLLDHPAQMTLKIVSGIYRKRGIIDRRTIGNHHQDLALLGAAKQPLVRPIESFAVDIFLQQTLAHHQPEVLARAAPRRIGRFIDDVAQIIEATGIRRLAGREPVLARLAALPGARGEAKNFNLDAAALKRARKNIRAGGGDGDRSTAHRARIVEQKRNDRISKLGVFFSLERKGMQRIDDDAREARRIELALLEIEFPGAVLLRHQAPLQPIGKTRDNAL